MCADYPQPHIYSGRDGKDEPGGIHSLYCGGEPHLGYRARCVGERWRGILGIITEYLDSCSAFIWIAMGTAAMTFALRVWKKKEEGTW